MIHQFQIPLEKDACTYILANFHIKSGETKIIDIPEWPLELPRQPPQPIQPNTALAS